jgi:hypothetical protein
VQNGDTLESIATQFELKDYFTLNLVESTNKYNPLRPEWTSMCPRSMGYYEAKDTISIASVAQEWVSILFDHRREYNNLYGLLGDASRQRDAVMVPGGQAQRDCSSISRAERTGNVSGGVVTGTYTLWGCTSEVSGGSMPFGRPWNATPICRVSVWAGIPGWTSRPARAARVIHLRLWRHCGLWGGAMGLWLCGGDRAWLGVQPVRAQTASPA